VVNLGAEGCVGHYPIQKHFSRLWMGGHHGIDLCVGWTMLQPAWLADKLLCENVFIAQ